MFTGETKNDVTNFWGVIYFYVYLPKSWTTDTSYSQLRTLSLPDSTVSAFIYENLIKHCFLAHFSHFSLPWQIHNHADVWFRIFDCHHQEVGNYN